MRAGQLTELITILRHNVVVNEYGEQRDTYTSIGTTRANVEPLSGGRADVNSEIFYEHTYRFTIRKYVNIGDFDHIMWNNKEYRVLNIDDDRYLNQKVVNAELINK
jgi:head-tail adaptor